MRTARPVRLTADGRSLIVVTDSGEELAILADDRLRAALRGDRPRLAQLEIELESALRPRDIQARIRAGESLEDVARAAGIPVERVEPFAAPVLAEREHVAGLAMASSVRRRGETSGHRNLRITLTDRLVSRGVDIDTLDWDSARMEDGRWSVTATYGSDESQRQATFLFDVRGRFSVAGNDEARWVLGEQSSVKRSQPGSEPAAMAEGQEPADTEPTLDLSDELALVRATAERQRGHLPGKTAPEEETSFQELHADWDAKAAAEEAAVYAELHRETGKRFDRSPAEVEPVPSGSLEATEEHQPGEGQLDTLYDMLGGDGYSEDSVRVYSGLSDASAVPETDNGGWEPAIVVNYPVEPGEQDDEEHDQPDGPNEPRIEPALHELGAAPEIAESEAAESDDVAREESEQTPVAPAEAPAAEAPDQDAGVVVERDAPTTDVADPGDDGREVQSEQAETLPLGEAGIAPPVKKKPAKRKRASVPSWDEIMFGGPPRDGGPK
ncbi:hypothetical protein GCM10009841_21150 [Microlunatus panaciterrae]|uniref:DUF3071 domain-containing protein n=1 Tax=Microlunatus panaciterrae TaxID=400768 RepID=A0ABS2RNT2_9ACTN|nr:septation protein SepH [Microlunatus panaciterrae]MBM7800668.1 hypothetical protein [Microlunatus panaciterrae]